MGFAFAIFWCAIFAPIPFILNGVLEKKGFSFDDRFPVVALVWFGLVVVALMFGFGFHDEMLAGRLWLREYLGVNK